MENKISELSLQDEERIPEFREQYRQIGLSTENLSEEEAFEIIDDLYKFLGKSLPTKYYVESPKAAVLKAMELDPTTTPHTHINNFWYGSFYAYYVCFYSFLVTIPGIKYQSIEKNLHHAKQLLKLGWILPYENTCIVSKKPVTLTENDFHQIHNENGPAVEYEDGSCSYYWRGMLVPEQWIKNPESITVEMISREENVERRRAMIEIIGYDRYIKETDSKLIHKDTVNVQEVKLWQSDFGYTKAKIVELINSTQENDGTYKHYFHRVPSRVTRAKEAVAALFGLSEEEYNPEVET